MIRLFFAQGFAVPSPSMMPTLRPGDYILVTPFSHGHRPARSDVVVFRTGDRSEPYFVKRVIALPGDYLQLRDGQVMINGYTLPEPYLVHKGTEGTVVPQIVPHDCYFVLGDNRRESFDSRALGLVPVAALVGKARLIYWSSASDPSGKKGRLISWSRILHGIH